MLFSSVFTAQAAAQNQAIPKLGITWETPVSPRVISSELALYKELGVSYIELTHPVNQAILDSLSNYSFDVSIRFEYQFLKTYFLKEYAQELIQEYSSLILEYSNYDFITAFGLYSYSQSFDTEFQQEFAPIESELRKITNRSFYQISTLKQSHLDFSLIEVTGDSILPGMDFYLLSKAYQRNHNHILNQLFNEAPNAIYIDSNWLNRAFIDYPPVKLALLELKNNRGFALPLPKKEESTPPFNWPIVVFVLIWVSVGIHIKVSATYKPLITRFFTGHRFFVDDIMRYRERSSISGLFLFFQHAFFTGLVVYTVSNLLISEVGLKALFDGFPQLAITGQNYFSIFLFGTALSFLVQLIGLAWLYIPSKSMAHFSQALTLYTWIFHLDFILVSMMLVLLVTGGSGTLILILVGLFIITWLAGFFLTSLDSSKYLMQKRASYMFYTFGLHTLVNIILLVFILSNQKALDFFELIFTI